jgi:glycine oxidase
MADHIVVGGGIIGLLTAHYLAETGAKVTLLERGVIGHESSWAGGGILSPLYPWRYPDAVNRLARWSQQHYPDLMATIHQNTGIDPEWIQSGLLILDAEETPDALEWAEIYDGNVSVVDADAIHALEPAVNAKGNGLWLPEVAQVRNPRLMRALKRHLLAQGVTIVENTEVSHLLVKHEHITGVRTLYSELAADNVIIACGAWSAALVKELGRGLDIVPVRGQMLLFKTPPGTLKRIVLSQGHYAIPRLDGRVLVGSTMEEVGFDKTVTDEAREDLVAVAHSLVPALAQAELETHWAGLRPGSPSGIPFIGHHPSVEGLYINAGHHRNGVVMAPASARLLADIVLGRPPSVDPHPYDMATRASAA